MERRAPLEAGIGRYASGCIVAEVSMLNNNRGPRTCTSFRVTNLWEGAINSEILLGVFRVEPCVLVIWHQYKKYCRWHCRPAAENIATNEGLVEETSRFP